jgi:hypothetical protein
MTVIITRRIEKRKKVCDTHGLPLCGEVSDSYKGSCFDEDDSPEEIDQDTAINPGCIKPGPTGRCNAQEGEIESKDPLPPCSQVAVGTTCDGTEDEDSTLDPIPQLTIDEEPVEETPVEIPGEEIVDFESGEDEADGSEDGFVLVETDSHEFETEAGEEDNGESQSEDSGGDDEGDDGGSQDSSGDDEGDDGGGDEGGDNQ